MDTPGIPTPEPEGFHDDDPQINEPVEGFDGATMQGVFDKLTASSKDGPLPEITDIARAMTNAIGGAEQIGQQFLLLYTDKRATQATRTKLFDSYLRILILSAGKGKDEATLTNKTKEQLEAKLYEIVKRQEAKAKKASNGAKTPKLDEAHPEKAKGTGPEGADPGAGHTPTV